MSGYFHNTTYGLPADNPGLIRLYDQICIKVIKKIAAEWGLVLATSEFNHTRANYYLVHFKNVFYGSCESVHTKILHRKTLDGT